jgi:Cu/Ag efflux pump CusA
VLNNIVRWSIERRWLVVLTSLAISIWGFRALGQMPLDVFPNFAPPQVEIQVDAAGVEVLF